MAIYFTHTQRHRYTYPRCVVHVESSISGKFQSICSLSSILLATITHLPSPVPAVILYHLSSFLRFSPVILHYTITTNQQLAGMVDRYNFVLSINNLDL